MWSSIRQLAEAHIVGHRKRPILRPFNAPPSALLFIAYFPFYLLEENLEPKWQNEVKQSVVLKSSHRPE